MIKDIKDKKIYAYCPASVVTGGCELIHQFIDYLNNHGCKAYIVYLGNKSHEVPIAYSSYNIKTANSIDDSENSVVVCGECFLYIASRIKKAQVVIWWLSVDNTYYDSTQLPYMSLIDVFRWKMRSGFRCIKLRIQKRIFFGSFSLYDIRKLGVINGYQSEYAKQYLESLGFNNLVPLKDYINTTYYQADKVNNSKRSPKVLYNPRKGIEFTKKLIQLAPEFEWVPLQGMNREQLLETFQTSMLYIDFGNHPGKDRLPREAALNGCCIITGRRGAAKNDVDINIPTCYKFDENVTPPNIIIKKIKYILENYDNCKTDFLSYQNNILGEKEEFEHQIDNLFGLKK